jgi:hypothetical protein
MLLVDLKGSLGTLPEHGGLYENALVEQPEPVWLNQVDVVRKEKCKNNEFLTDVENEEKTGKELLA